MPSAERMIFDRCAHAIVVGLDIAAQRGVDLWYTEDVTHLMRLAAHREDDQQWPPSSPVRFTH